MNRHKGQAMSLVITLAKILGVIFVAYAAYCGYYYFNQRKSIFPIAHIPVQEPDIGSYPELEVLWLDTSQGKVEAWFLPPIEGSGKPYPVMILGHGNGELIDFYPASVAYVRQLGLGALLVEYPGYGRSEGTPSKAGIGEAFTLAYDTITAREEVDGERVVLFGLSLGGGAVCELAKVRPTKALILMSTFTSIKEYAWKLYLPPFLIRDPFDNLAVLREYPGSVLVIHGTRDELVPYDMGLKLHQAAPHGRMISYDCGHNDCIVTWELFWREVEPFLREAGVVD
jgi:pimeloyl-ACP methyl ester carboxylesterase